MNLWEKITIARVKLQEKKLKKSGHNKFSGFDYFELADFLPEINKINQELKILTIFNATQEKATLKIINIEKTDEVEQFEIENIKADLKGANNIQALGATQTYLKRYLYLNAYEIQENDMIDQANKNKIEQLPPLENLPHAITESQRKRLFALSNGKQEKTKEIMAKYGYISSKEIKKEDYEKICKEIEEA